MKFILTGLVSILLILVLLFRPKNQLSQEVSSNVVDAPRPAKETAVAEEASQPLAADPLKTPQPVTSSESDPKSATDATETISQPVVDQPGTGVAGVLESFVLVTEGVDHANWQSKTKTLPNPKQTYESATMALQVLGENITAVNGTYNGEIKRPNLDACPLSISIDGQVPSDDGSSKRKFTGRFSIDFQCNQGITSRGNLIGDIENMLRVTGEKPQALLFTDNASVLFESYFSKDFNALYGRVYDMEGKAQATLIGEFQVQR